jgi:hypothetical protein
MTTRNTRQPGQPTAPSDAGPEDITVHIRIPAQIKDKARRQYRNALRATGLPPASEDTDTRVPGSHYKDPRPTIVTPGLGGTTHPAVNFATGSDGAKMRDFILEHSHDKIALLQSNELREIARDLQSQGWRALPEEQRDVLKMMIDVLLRQLIQHWASQPATSGYKKKVGGKMVPMKHTSDISLVENIWRLLETAYEG